MLDHGNLARRHSLGSPAWELVSFSSPPSQSPPHGDALHLTAHGYHLTYAFLNAPAKVASVSYRALMNPEVGHSRDCLHCMGLPGRSLYLSEWEQGEGRKGKGEGMNEFGSQIQLGCYLLGVVTVLMLVWKME